MLDDDFALVAGMSIHLAGIGGSGMSAIARLLLERGFSVSGCDVVLNELTTALAADGATIYRGHRPEHIVGASALVVSSALPSDNLEILAAREARVPVLKRADLLGILMRESIGIAVAGTHGKSTTTAMIGHVLAEAGLDPTVVVGGLLPSLGGNARYGRGAHFVVEADEYDYMFWGLHPDIAVVTNVEHDHPDVFPSPDDYREAFEVFVRQLPPDGRLVLCGDNKGARGLAQGLPDDSVPVTTYGLQPDNDLVAIDCRANPMGGTDFLVSQKGNTLGLMRLRVPGQHNVLNSLAAIAVSMTASVAFHDICQALASYGGVGRRFQVVGEFGDVIVIDDYAHHPTEIKATLQTARQLYPGRRIWAVWQPHTYSRTRLLLKEFADSFGDADRVVALDIYGSREQESLAITTPLVLAQMKAPPAAYVPEIDQATQFLLERVRPGDVVLTLGAGDGNRVGTGLLQALREQMSLSVRADTLNRASEA